jgi:hypothetical protein
MRRKSNVLNFPTPTVDHTTPQEGTPRQITRDNIAQLLDTGQLEAQTGDGVWRKMFRGVGEWRCTGLHRAEGLVLNYKIKYRGAWYNNMIDQFDASGVLNRPDIRINPAIDGAAYHRPASEIKAIVADLMKDASLYSVLSAVESVCIDNAWSKDSNQPIGDDRFFAWIDARGELGKLLDKRIVAKVSTGDIADPRRVRREKWIAKAEERQRKLRAKAERYTSLREALIKNADQPQASFVKQFRVHPITVRRCRRELEEAGAIPVLAHRHGPTGQRHAQLAEAAD